MIHISKAANLGIILPNTNKALAQVLKNATDKELEVLSKGKDLKTIMSTILKQSTHNDTSNKELLELVKNNPTLKSLGDVRTTLKDILNTMQQNKEPMAAEKVLKNFLGDIKDLKPNELKQKVQNSGIFLESKLKNVTNPQTELKNTLIQLTKTLESSKLPVSRSIINEAKVLLGTEQLKNTSYNDLTKDIQANPKTLEQLSNSVKSITDKLASIIKTADAIHNPELSKHIDKLEYNNPKNLSSENFKLTSIKDSLNALASSMHRSFTVESKNIILALEKVLQSIQKLELSMAKPSPTNDINSPLENMKKSLLEIENNSQKQPQSSLQDNSSLSQNKQQTLERLSQETRNILNNIKDIVPTKNIPTALAEMIQKIDSLFNNKQILANPAQLQPIQDILDQLSKELKTVLNQDNKSLNEILKQITQSIKTVQQLNLSEQYTQNRLPEQIHKITEDIKSVILKSDTIFSKDVSLILNKLEFLSTPQSLNINNNVKEILLNDLKAVVLQTTEELTKSNMPQQTELLRLLDKLALQIDHYQLLSHLSNGTSLFLPFSWDMMEEGNIDFKKDENEKFYVDIDLKLKEYGELHLKLALYDKNQLNIHIYSSSEELKSVLQNNIPELRSALIEMQITPREIRLHEPKTEAKYTSPYQSDDDNIELGFEVKV